MESLIVENNEKRRLLNKENKKIYEDMLMYVRLSYNKSVAETEEVLMELLDHLLILQQEGRVASELFGDNPKQYANEIVGELPQKMLSKKMIMQFFMGVFYFLGVAIFLNGLVSTVCHYGFGLPESNQTYYVGTLAINTLLSLGIAFILVYAVIRYICWACFKDVTKIFELLFTGIVFGALPFGIFLALFYFMPSFGPPITIELYWLILIGICFYLLGSLFKRKA
ncbi:DUF1129 family protein [Alkalibacillus haloalkaliphilus]|uniref:DUF1129 family protein n=1 Tax=Alkalibacillus haloalkaliphilus TaxID=94136 RepID=UPI0002E36582|nr:DUF1129 family protein [Alkalibacillus haloalkaliphilus]